MTPWRRLDRRRMAEIVADDIPDGSYVNLGIGMPTLVGGCLPADREIILHSENGIVGMGPKPDDGPIDTDLINAGKQGVGLVVGAAITEHVVSFSMMRGGHLGLTVLGAFQVSAGGDLANWDTGAPDAIPAVGGAMDLVAGGHRVVVMMEHVTRDGLPKIVRACTYPLTGSGCVDRIYTDLAVIDVTPEGLRVRAMVDALAPDDLQRLTDAPLRFDGRIETLADHRIPSIPSRTP